MLSMLAALPLMLGSANAVADSDHCASTAAAVRSSVADGELDLSPHIRALLLDVTDDKRHAVENDVQRLRAELDKQQMSRWLDWSLFTATYNNRSAIAEWLVEQGANVDAHPLEPTFDGGQKFPSERMWPPVEQAAACGNVATLKVLLAHHADMYGSIQEPSPMPGPLLQAIIGRHQATVETLLDYGYDPCLIRANYYLGPPAAEMAKRQGLTDTVIKRLTALSEKCATSAPAQSAAASAQINLCATEAPMLRTFFAQQGYAVSPKIAKLMVDVSDGKEDAVEQDTRDIQRSSNSTDAKHWLNLALYTAVTDGRADIVGLLIRDGADVNAHPEYPPWSAIGVAMFNAGWQEDAKKLHIKARHVDVKEFGPYPPAVPMVEQAAMCGHVAALKILLTNRADMYPTVGMEQNGSKSGVLPALIINHNEDSIQILLDHGYDPCRDFQENPNPQHLTDVILAKRIDLSVPLVERITALSARCPAALMTSSTH